jgi:hypothetical protein
MSKREITDPKNIARVVKVLRNYPRVFEGSMHIHEEIYETRRKTVRMFYVIGGSHTPFSVEIERH